MVLPLKQGIIYGPVNSRRYGKSLGINLMPIKDKLCSFNCVYCHYGITRRCTMNMDRYSDDLPKFDDVVRALEDVLKQPAELDLITFSGNGEPTLYPRFGKLVEEVVRLRHQYRPDTKVALLSNSSGLFRDDVLESLDLIDLPVLKLDAGNAEIFKAINRPVRSVDFQKIVDKLASLDGVYLQTVFVDGTPSNTDDETFSDYLKLVEKIRPREIHAYSTDRPTPSSKINRVPPDKLEELAARILGETGIEALAFYN